MVPAVENNSANVAAKESSNSIGTKVGPPSSKLATFHDLVFLCTKMQKKPQAHTRK